MCFLVHFAEYMMMCMAPWTELRDPAFVGGQLYFLLIMCVARSRATVNPTNH